jgi:hypothetical protein
MLKENLEKTEVLTQKGGYCIDQIHQSDQTKAQAEALIKKKGEETSLSTPEKSATNTTEGNNHPPR